MDRPPTWQVQSQHRVLLHPTLWPTAERVNVLQQGRAGFVVDPVARGRDRDGDLPIRRSNAAKRSVVADKGSTALKEEASVFDWEKTEKLVQIKPSQMEVAPLHRTFVISHKRRLFKNTKGI